MELVPAQRQCLALFERDYCSSPSSGTADQSNLTESLSGSEDGDDDELTAGLRYAHADVPRGNQVESIGRVALMNDHLIAMVGPPPKPSDQPAPLLRRQRCENRPVHDSTMPLIACLETVPVSCGCADCLGDRGQQVWNERFGETRRAEAGPSAKAPWKDS